MPRIVTVINDLLISYHTGTRKGFGVNIRDNRESDRGRRVFPLPDLPLPYVVDRAGILNYFRSFFRTQDGEGYIPAGSLVRGSEAEKIYHLFSTSRRSQAANYRLLRLIAVGQNMPDLNDYCEE